MILKRFANGAKLKTKFPNFIKIFKYLAKNITFNGVILTHVTDSFVNSQEWTLSRSVPDLRVGIVGSLSSGKSALVHRYLTGSYMQEESPEGGRFKKEVVIDGQSHLLLIRDEGGLPELQVGYISAACGVPLQSLYLCSYVDIVFISNLYKLFNPSSICSACHADVLIRFTFTLCTFQVYSLHSWLSIIRVVGYTNLIETNMARQPLWRPMTKPLKRLTYFGG